MKRPIAFAAIVLGGLLVLTACSRPATPVEDQAADDHGWVAPPEVDGVVASRDGLVITGRVAPLGRVVLTDAVAGAYAVGADEAGRFQLRAPRPARDTLFSLETRVGQIAYPSPARLLVAAAPDGPIALLAAGAPTRRLDAAPALDAVDSDGRASFVSGRAAPGATVSLDGAQVKAGRDGRWTASGPGAGDAPISVDGAVFQPALQGGVSGVLERAGAGWRISWEDIGGGRQMTWFPNQLSAAATHR